MYFPNQSEPLRLSRRSAGLRLLQRARDEAHRFGVAYSRNRRSDRTITSLLLEIPGIGPNRRSPVLSNLSGMIFNPLRRFDPILSF